ncbi:VOC family protein [Pyxidicoccus sp. 3LG]
MRKTPEGWPRITPGVFYDDAHAAIDWLGRAFGFETRLKIEGAGGEVVHSELVFGDGVIMVNGASKPPHRSPRSLGAVTHYLQVYVDDVDAHCARARAAGAKVWQEPETKDYGEDWGTNRSYGAEDLEGHRWWFTQQLVGAKK